MDELVQDAIALLPPTGQTIEFDTFKGQLYAAQPDNGRDVFAHMIKRNLVEKVLSRDDNGKIIVLLSRKATK